MNNAVEKIRVLAVDDHPLLREGISVLINAEQDMELIAEAANGREAIAEYQAHRPDITLMDLQMPDFTGIEAIHAIRRQFPEARIIVLTTYEGDAQAVRALEAGAQGYLLKGHVHRELLHAIRTVHAGRRFIPNDLALVLVEHMHDEKLTEREMEVLRLISGGNANKVIAARLSITEETVKKHVGSILGKLGANDRTHAVTIAVKRGIITV